MAAHFSLMMPKTYGKIYPDTFIASATFFV